MRTTEGGKEAAPITAPGGAEGGLKSHTEMRSPAEAAGPNPAGKWICTARNHVPVVLFVFNRPTVVHCVTVAMQKHLKTGRK